MVNVCVVFVISLSCRMQRLASRATVLKRCFATGKELKFGVEVCCCGTGL